MSDFVPPAKVRIGPLSYRVRVRRRPTIRGKPVDGHITYSRVRIVLAAHLKPQMARLTLWHEIVHGILTHGAITDQDERLVEVVAAGVVQVLRDNPELGRV